MTDVKQKMNGFNLIKANDDFLEVSINYEFGTNSWETSVHLVLTVCQCDSESKAKLD